MRKLLLFILPLVGIALGVFAGTALTGGQKEAKVETEQDVPEKKKEKSKSKSEGTSGDHEFLKMSKQFVVPLLDGEHLAGLANLALSLEVAPGTSEPFYAREPKLRDAFLQVLFDHANTGGFDGAFTMSGKLDPLRQALLDAAQHELGPDVVHAVLIVDIARQDNY
ncbi:flagellar basal body-associated FliL family protein [Ruegeria sp. 2205SS24-7]|uniref:flagellar basal body-associated FliL family protein n=1 Tax=Ruegeria discodermiae TaxID=3064389 RepID=UPI0027403445|nr:flagellar basal body-associated FliL family protein [Ruegeria sp. 2205SS24-7]MDP5220022.1 flagellar basal body-associated FliL family protein [Ruegeria sp. 2205SS24-7]